MKAYLSRNNLHAVADVGGVPYNPFRTGSVARPSKRDKRKPDALWEQMFHHFTLRQADFLQHYHKRSNVETTFHMVKAKFGGETLLANSGLAQVNETLMRVLCHNICVVIKAMYQLGIGPDFTPRGNLGQDSALDPKSIAV